MISKFFTFLDTLEKPDNKLLIESIKSGYSVIYDSIVMTPLPMARITGMGEDKPTEPISGEWNIRQNKDNEYFEQTLPDSVQAITNKSYIGSRIGAYPKAGNAHNKSNGDRYQSGNWGDSGPNGEGYAGSSGGYNLGGPTSAG